MSTQRWFPLKHALPDGTTCGALLSSGGEWQIFRVDRRNKVLVARAGLGDRWIASGLLCEAALLRFRFGEEDYIAISSGADQQLAPVAAFTPPENKTDALAFALSFRETRRVASDAPLQDALFVERFSRLLPTWTLSEVLDDCDLLGRWLTGGVAVSTSAFRRLSSLLGWLGEGDVREILEAAGLPAPPRAHGHNPDPRAKSGAETSRTPESRPLLRSGLQSTLWGDESEGGSRFRLLGRPSLEAFFNEHVIDIVVHPDRYQALGIGFPSAVVLYGPPGCGKTYAVERLGEYLDWPIFQIDSASVGSPYIHETSRKVSEVFDKAMDAAPAMIVIDEMESYLADRQLHQSTGLHHVEEVAEFLRRIPEAGAKQVLVIGMTNRLNMIDPAILRRGRFDHVIEVGMPSREEVYELFTALLERLPVEAGVAAERAVAVLTGRPLSDTAFCVREASRLAARAGKRALDQQSVDDAIGALPRQGEAEAPRPIGFVWD